MEKAGELLAGTVRIHPAVAARWVGDEIVLLHLGEGVYFSLNNVGAFIWSHLEHNAQIESIVDAIMTEYDVDAVRATRDLGDFLDGLQQHCLLAAR